MILTVTTTHRPATDIGYLLHKNPYRCQSVELSFGRVYVFYPAASDNECTVAILLDVNPVSLVRDKRRTNTSMPLEQYVNDRPYVSSSYMSVALSQVFGQTLNGKCKRRPELVGTVMPLSCEIVSLPSRGGERLIRNLFEPLGYKLEVKQHILDSNFPEWGNSTYFTVQLYKETTIYELFNHVYVLMPVLDNQKHYYIGASEIEKLIKRGDGWLSSHPEKENIARRYLRHRSSYVKEALMRLMDANPSADGEVETNLESTEDTIEKKINLNEERIGTVISVLKSEGVESVIDLGCGEGKLLRQLLKDKQFKKITGLDVSIRSLEIAHEKLRIDNLPTLQKKRIQLIHGSLMYRDRRLEGYDCASIVEVIEHLDQARIAAFERVIFEFTRPQVVVITTPNREYNILFENLPAGKLRHSDHRFEWSRKEFTEWAYEIAARFNYSVRFLPIGQEDKKCGSPTQMGIFTRNHKE